MLFSIRAGTRIPNSVGSVRRVPAFTIPAGCSRPGAVGLTDPAQYPRLEAYVKGLVGAFKNDKRILAWDVWNEPDNTNGSSYGASEPINKVELVNKLLPQAFQWARSQNPLQPLTSGVWKGDYSADDKLDATQKIQLENSDIITFHNYDNGVEFEKRINWLKRYDRPILCTEYMARGNNSTFQNTLPVAKKYKVAAINWGLVGGKSQTFLRGIRGRIRMSGAIRKSGFTKFSALTARRICRKKST